MSGQVNSFTPEQIAERGDAIYQRAIRAQVEKDNRGKVLAIDVTSGDYAMGKNALEAADLLREKRPESVVWLMRIGYRALHQIGRPRTLRRT